MRNAIRNGTTRWTRWVALTLWIPIMAIAQASTAFEETVFIEGIEGGLYSGFEFTIEMDETVEPSPDQPETMPRITLTGLVGPRGAETPVQSLVFDEEFWGQGAEFVDAVGLEWLEGLGEDGDSAGGSGPGSGPGAGSGSGAGGGPTDDELRYAAEDFLAFSKPLLEPHQAMIEEFDVALASGITQVAIGEAGDQSACDSRFDTFIGSMMTVWAKHFLLGIAIPLSGTTCNVKILKPLGWVLCAMQIGMWVKAGAEIAIISPSAWQAKFDLDTVVSSATKDKVGQQINALTYYANDIARHAKLSEQNAYTAGMGFDGPQWSLAILQVPGDYKVRLATLWEIQSLITAGLQWLDYWKCQRRVIAPRFEASSIRVRPYLVTRGETKKYDPAGYGFELTAMPREIAREDAQTWKINAETLFEESPDSFPIFNETTQEQNLTVNICEGVVVSRDPGQLLWPPQEEDTPYVLTEDDHMSEALPFFGKWWAGIGKEATILQVPFGAVTHHRACEDRADRMIDNNNDGEKERNSAIACELFPVEELSSDKRGELEEDTYEQITGPPLVGPSAWEKGDDSDMRCTAITLDLASKKEGITKKHVKHEVVLDVASYWTNAADGTAAAGASQHLQDSTQIRFLIEDTDWGEPRPRGCYAWDPVTSKWSCKVGARQECACGGGVGGAPGF